MEHTAVQGFITIRTASEAQQQAFQRAQTRRIRRPKCLSSPSELLAQLQAFNAASFTSLDPLLRRNIYSAASQLTYNLEDPATTIFRLTVGQATESAVLKIALDIGLFPLLAKDNKPKPLSVLAEGTSTDPTLLLRIVRFLAAFGVVNEHEGGTYSLAACCGALGDETFASATNTVVDLVRPVLDAVPGLIRENGRQNPHDRFNGAAQKVFNAPGQELFEMLKDMGTEVAQGFGTFLSATAKNSAKMRDVYPVQERLVEGFEMEKNEIFWVDVGGGFGQYTLDLKKSFSLLPGRCVVQDLGPMVAQAKAKGLDEYVEFEEHDFFEEQLVKGARAYYFRQCFHNWQDENCKVMLERTAAAMEPGYSRLLIHDIVMPEVGTGAWEVMMDWLMMAAYSTLERSEEQWNALVRSAGLKINKIYAKPTSPESVIEIIKE